MLTSAAISEDGQYRYSLTRTWRMWPSSSISQRGFVLFICLNPSTADGTVDDNTSRRCIGFATHWGYGSMVMANLFAYRSTDPNALLSVRDPVGPDNDRYLKRLGNSAAMIIAAWGTKGTLLNRDQTVKEMFRDRLAYLRLTKENHPEHPLYLPATLIPYPWRY